MPFFFFFQAEDGIRDIGVTGVQTCALPISRSPPPAPQAPQRSPSWRGSGAARSSFQCGRSARSEERRVGKECRSRWLADHEKIEERPGEVRGEQRKGTDETTLTLAADVRDH